MRFIVIITSVFFSVSAYTSTLDQQASELRAKCLHNFEGVKTASFTVSVSASAPLTRASAKSASGDKVTWDRDAKKLKWKRGSGPGQAWVADATANTLKYVSVSASVIEESLDEQHALEMSTPSPRWLWHPEWLIQKGKIIRRYFALPDGRMVGHMDSSANKVSFHHFDALGSSIATTEKYGKLISTNIYEPFGGSVSKPQTGGLFGFVGEYGVESCTEETIRMGARYYDSQTGRFITRDLFILFGLLLRPYSYVDNNPLIYFDPLGFFTYKKGGQCPVKPVAPETASKINWWRPVSCCCPVLCC